MRSTLANMPNATWPRSLIGSTGGSNSKRCLSVSWWRPWPSDLAQSPGSEWLTLLANQEAPSLPQGFRPRGAGPDAAPHPLVDRHRALPPRSGHRSTSSAMSMLWKTICEGRLVLITQYNLRSFAFAQSR
jgi:hypothetical protein